jgi:hypothetical protein
MFGCPSQLATTNVRLATGAVTGAWLIIKVRLTIVERSSRHNFLAQMCDVLLLRPDHKLLSRFLKHEQELLFHQRLYYLKNQKQHF